MLVWVLFSIIFVVSPPKIVYVDDIVIIGTTPDVGVHVVKSLSDIFPIKDLGTLDYFLGLEAPYNFGGMILTDQKHALDLLHRLSMESFRATLPWSD
jgi:hypothetical protein